MFMENKKINIIGQYNRYNIKKANKEKKDKNNLCNVLKIFIKNKKTQIEELNKLYLTEPQLLNETQKIIKRELQKKRNSYRQQDIKKNILNETTLITTEQIIEKLVASKLCCFYCRQTIWLIYDNYRDPYQWTLDRMDNNTGHNYNNVLISCLGCNLKRGTMKKEDFEFAKNLKVIKCD